MNTSLARVKRPVSFKLIWPPIANADVSEFQGLPNNSICSIWFPEAPKGYIALGCVVSTGRTQPPLSSAFCILASLVSPCDLQDCITISSSIVYVTFPCYIWMSTFINMSIHYVIPMGLTQSQIKSLVTP